MNYLFAPESVNERQIVFRNLSDAMAPNGRLEMSDDLEDFSIRLTRLNMPEIIIMLAVGQNNMPAITSLSALVGDAALIILLSDCDMETVKSAMRMRPKFIGTMERDLEHVVPIIKKLIQARISRDQKRIFG